MNRRIRIDRSDQPRVRRSAPDEETPIDYEAESETLEPEPNDVSKKKMSSGPPAWDLEPDLRIDRTKRSRG